MIIQRLQDQRVIVSQGARADTYWTRLVGWMGRSSVNVGDGLLISRTNSIHMWMMRFPIDAVFLNRELTVLKTATRLKPWRPLPLMCWGADSVLELPAGTVDLHGIKNGEVLCIVS